MENNTKLTIFSLLIVVLIAGTVLINSLPDKAQEIIYKELVADVKGSIYESGETISLFGTCRDADLNYINATALLTTYYPNASIMFSNTSMSQFEQGKYLYSSPMSSVQGTYLTMMECVYQGQSAFAYGEWQNPYWVARLAVIQNLTNSTAINLENLTLDVDLGFNISYDYFEQINTTINNLDIGNVTLGGNYSAILIGIAKTIGACVECTLTTEEYYRTPLKYWKNWHIYAKVYNEFGKDVTDVVECNITTDRWGTEEMTYQDTTIVGFDDSNDDNSNGIPKKCTSSTISKNGVEVEPTCPRFYYGHKVDFKGDLNWNITCDWLSKPQI